MCRVRFGLTGIYFDSLEPSRPREEFVQPLIATIPPVAQNKPGDAVPEAVDGGEIRKKVVIATEISKNHRDGTPIDISDSSSLSSREGHGRRSVKNAKKNHAPLGCKRERNSVSSSSSSPSSSPASSPPASDEDQVQALANNKINVQAFKPLASSRTSQKRNKKPSKRQTSTSPEGLTKAPPAKRVRFAMDLQENIIPCDDPGGTSSSHSSDDSYTDPPSPTEPHDAFGDNYRTPGASRSRGMRGQIAGQRMRIPVETEDIIDDFLDSEDGSEVDVQGLPVNERPPSTIQVPEGLASDQRHHHNNPISLARSKYSARVMDQSRNIAGGLESNIDNGLHFKESHWSENRPVSSPQSGKQLRYPRLRSGKNLPEPIFVVRPRFLANAGEKGKPADTWSSGYKGISRNGHEGTKTPPSGPIQVKAPRKNKSLKYCPPAVTDELEKKAEFDQDLGMLIRDV